MRLVVSDKHTAGKPMVEVPKPGLYRVNERTVEVTKVKTNLDAMGRPPPGEFPRITLSGHYLT